MHRDCLSMFVISAMMSCRVSSGSTAQRDASLLSCRDAAAVANTNSCLCPSATSSFNKVTTAVACSGDECIILRIQIVGNKCQEVRTNNHQT